MQPSSNIRLSAEPDANGKFTGNYVPGDSVPNTIVLTPASVTDATPTVPYTATTTVAGINVPTSISVTGAGMRYKIGAGAFTTTPGTVNNGDVVTVELIASSSGNTSVGGALNIGGQVANFIVTTADAPPAPVGSWTINAAYRVGQKLPMKVIHPRPDVETNSYAVHRVATSHVAYKMRIGVQGGEAPFKFEIVSGPAGASVVGEFARSIDSLTGLTVHTFPTDRT